MINLEERVLFCDSLWWFIVFMLPYQSLFMPHRLPILVCSCHTGFKLKIKKNLCTVPRIQHPRIFPFHWLCMSFLDMVTGCSLSVLAQVVQLYWSPELDRNQTGIFGVIISWHHISVCRRWQNMFILDCGRFGLYLQNCQNYLISHN